MKFLVIGLFFAVASSVGLAATTKLSGNSATSSCPCSGTKYCVGPRGGSYCITSGGKKQYAKKH